jgi:hypothetical protein
MTGASGQCWRPGGILRRTIKHSLAETLTNRDAPTSRIRAVAMAEGAWWFRTSLLSCAGKIRAVAAATVVASAKPPYAVVLRLLLPARVVFGSAGSWISPLLADAPTTPNAQCSLGAHTSCNMNDWIFQAEGSAPAALSWASIFAVWLASLSSPWRKHVTCLCSSHSRFSTPEAAGSQRRSAPVSPGAGF